MKQRRIDIIAVAGIFLTLLASGCGQKTVIPMQGIPKVDRSQTMTAEQADFTQAESLFAAQAYSEALKAYQNYLTKYPSGPKAPAALMKIGAIHTRQGRYAQARQAYKALITDFPDSYFVPDAIVEILDTFYAQGDYAETIAQARAILPKVSSLPHRLRIYLLLGDTFMAGGAFKDAVFAYAEVLTASDPQFYPKALEGLKQAVSKLDAQDAGDLLAAFQTTPLVRSYLLFQLGRELAANYRMEDAKQALTEFLGAFPEHEYAQTAKNLLNTIAQAGGFGHDTLGCLLPLSGTYSIFGTKALKGLELALYNFNAQMRNHANVKVIIRDTASDEARTREAAKELCTLNVSAIIGPMIMAQAAANVAQDNHVPIIALSQKDGIPEIGDYVFRHFLTPGMQVKTLVNHAVVDLGLRRFAILYPNEPYGVTYMNLFWDEVIAQNGQVLGVEAYHTGDIDFGDPVKKLVGLYYRFPPDLKPRELLDSGPSSKDDRSFDAIVDFDAVFIPDAPDRAGMVIPYLAYHDVDNVYLLGTNLWHSKELIRLADQYLGRARIVDAFFADSRDPQVAAFVQQFQETYGEAPGFLEAVTYDTAMILFKQLVRPDIRSRAELKDELLHMGEYPGVTGPTGFLENGETRKKLYLLKVKGDKFVELEPR